MALDARYIVGRRRPATVDLYNLIGIDLLANYKDGYIKLKVSTKIKTKQTNLQTLQAKA